MNEIAVRSNTGAPTEHEMMVFQTMAKHATTSKMYKGIGDESAIMMIMLAARELGIPCMQALNGGLNIINGKVELSARMMSALIRKAGHQILIKDSSDTACTLMGVRCHTGESATASFTLVDAQKAGLVKPGGGWTKFPKDMLFARALSRLARQLFSDVIGIGYVEGEIKATEAAIEPMDVVMEVDSADKANQEAEKLEELLSQFTVEDRVLVMEYMKVVMAHFNWSQAECVLAFLSEKSLHDKFHAWKNKQVIA